MKNSNLKNVLMATLASGALLTVGCGQSKEGASSSDKEMDKFVSELMGKMTLEEKIGQTVLFSSWWDVTGPVSDNDYVKYAKHGKVGAIFNALTADFLYRMQKEVVDSSRLGIPLLFGYDVIHGYHTTFPTPLAISSSWDMDMVELATRTMAEEASADGLHWTYAPMVDICRDPRWGRIAEGAGEDPFLGSAIARAQVKGIQGDDLSANNTMLACVKHFAAYGAPVAGRDYNSVDMSERHLREFYLPPYKAAFDAGCATAMASFNDISGVPATCNRWLLTDLLRDEWGFKGMVVTDYTGIMELLNHATAKDSADAGAQSLHAGVDMDMQSAIYMKFTKENLDNKAVTEAEINQACRRVLEAKYKLGLFEDPFRYCDTVRAKQVLEDPKYAQNSFEVAKRSIVLLKNEKEVLPISKETRSIALIGPFVREQRDQLGAWHTAGRKELVVTIEEGFKKKYPSAQFNIAEGCTFESNFTKEVDSRKFAEALAAARRSDVVVMCLGEEEFESGEAASKTDLRLSATQRALIREVKKAGKPMVLLLHNGRPMILTEEEPLFDAILEVWHLGVQAGPAMAEVVSGDYNPSAKLTATFPLNMGQIPVYYNALPTGRPETTEKFTSRYTDSPNQPLYPFGYGLSYTKFAYSPVTLDASSMTADGKIIASVEVSNIGKYDGEEVVEMYIRDMVASVSRPVKELKGFRKVNIAAGDSIRVEFEITKEELSFYNAKLERKAEPGEFTVFIGGCSNTNNSALFTLE